jgi:effector-binding domain-containing protein
MTTLTTPRFEERAEQPCMFIRTEVRMGEIESKVVPLIPQLFEWLQAHGVSPVGPLFFRYNVIDMDGQMEIDVGTLVGKPAAGDARVQSGTVPAGSYVTMRHTGHPEELMPATAYLLAWGQQHQVAWRKQARGGSAEAWDGRYEFYLDGPDTEPDMSKWRTDLVFAAEPR